MQQKTSNSNDISLERSHLGYECLFWLSTTIAYEDLVATLLEIVYIFAEMNPDEQDETVFAQLGIFLWMFQSKFWRI